MRIKESVWDAEEVGLYEIFLQFSRDSLRSKHVCDKS